MKKVISILLALVIVMSCAGLVACGGETEDVDNGATPSPATSDATPSSGGNLSWNDIPVYSGAKQVQKGSWAIPPEQGEWSEMEWRYYETGDSPEEVSAFYKSKMLDQGWQEMMWMEAEGIAWGYYSKNSEADGAMFWCGSEEGETFFALMRAKQ